MQKKRKNNNFVIHSFLIISLLFVTLTFIAAGCTIPVEIPQTYPKCCVVKDINTNNVIGCTGSKTNADCLVNYQKYGNIEWRTGSACSEIQECSTGNCLGFVNLNDGTIQTYFLENGEKLCGPANSEYSNKLYSCTGTNSLSLVEDCILIYGICNDISLMCEYPSFEPSIIVWQDSKWDGYDIAMCRLVQGANDECGVILSGSRVSGEGSQMSPDVYINNITWEDYTQKNIWLFNTNTGIYRIVSDYYANIQPPNRNPNTRSPAIYSNKIVWSDDRNGLVYVNWDIYMCDLTSGSANECGTHNDKKISQDSSDSTAAQQYPDVYGDVIVWQDFRNNNYDIYMYDLLAQQEKPVITTEYSQSNPAIYGTKIVWQNAQDGKIHMCDVNDVDSVNGCQNDIAIPLYPNTKLAQYPDIFGDIIVWQAVSIYNNKNNIYAYDYKVGGNVVQLNPSSYEQYYPRIYGHKAVWEDYRDVISHILMYDFETQQTIYITGVDGYQTVPGIS